jgi:hypothetical protein
LRLPAGPIHARPDRVAGQPQRRDRRERGVADGLHARRRATPAPRSAAAAAGWLRAGRRRGSCTVRCCPCERARGDRVELPDGHTQERALLDVAFTVEVIAELQARHAADPASAVYGVERLAGRDVAFDRGLFWADVHTPPAADLGHGDVGFYINLVCAKGAADRSVVIKAGFANDPDRMGAVFDHAQRVGPPDEGWMRGQRRVSKNSVGCWKRSINGMTAADAADMAVLAARWIRALG